MPIGMSTPRTSHVSNNNKDTSGNTISTGAPPNGILIVSIIFSVLIVIIVIIILVNYFKNRKK